MAGLFDIFTGNPQHEGQQNARDFLQDIRQETAQTIDAGFQRGLGMLQGGVQPQLDSLNQGFAQANQLYGGFGNQAINALQTGTGWGVQSIHDMLQPAVQAWGPVNETLSQFGNERELAANMAKSGLGLTDPSVARAAFRTSPGYEFMLGEGLESIARNANRAGMLASGNQMRESQTFGSGLADKEWDDWMNRLFAREGLYAPLQVQGEAAMASKLGDLYSQAGRSLADIQTGYGKSAAGVLGQQGRDMAQLAAQLGGAQAGIFGQAGREQAEFLRQLLGMGVQSNLDLASGMAGTFVGQGNAEAQASANSINALVGLANMALKASGVGGFGNLSSPTAASSTSFGLSA